MESLLVFLKNVIEYHGGSAKRFFGSRFVGANEEFWARQVKFDTEVPNFAAEVHYMKYCV